MGLGVGWLPFAGAGSPCTVKWMRTTSSVFARRAARAGGTSGSRVELKSWETLVQLA